MRVNYKKRRKKIYALILLLTISIGYALLSTTLKINGIANIKSNTWDIHWDDNSIQVTDGSINPTSAATVTDSKKTIVDFNVEFEMPGDYYEFYIDAVNEGSIDGVVESVIAKAYDSTGTQETTLPSYLLYQVVYGDTETVPQVNDVLQAGKLRTYKVRVEFDTAATTLPQSNETYKFSVEIKYSQGQVRKSVSPRTCAQFESDSWSTIKKNVDIDPTVYPVGCTKDVTLSNYGTHTVRVANNTNPSVCSSNGYSQTACGFVLEFTDSITSDIYNNYDTGRHNGDGNYGGWKYSLGRTHVNSDIYNALPSELKNIIIDTKVVSSHGPFESVNYETTDKLYLLDSKEVFGESVTYDTIAGLTRQLDYYSSGGSKIKQYNNTNDYWWLSTADLGSNNNVFASTASGTLMAYFTIRNAGFSPAFRIGTKIDEFDTVPENNQSVKTSTTSDTSCGDTTPPKCNLNYVTTFNSGFRYSFSCTDDTEINRITSLFDEDPYNGQYNSSTFETIGGIKNGTVINNGKTEAYTSQWTIDNSNPPSRSVCYYFVYGGEDKCGNWVAYHTPICYQY